MGGKNKRGIFLQTKYYIIPEQQNRNALIYIKKQGYASNSIVWKMCKYYNKNNLGLGIYYIEFVLSMCNMKYFAFHRCNEQNMQEHGNIVSRNLHEPKVIYIVSTGPKL